MCPDKELLSAYCDGEVPSPWKEKIQQHLAVCRSCAETVSSYGRIRESLRGDLPETLDLSGIKKRLGGALGRPKVSPLWTRRISLSWPVLAALVVLIFGTGAGFSLLLNRGRASPEYLAAEQTTPLDLRIKVKDLSQLLEILNHQELFRELTIQLPETKPYQFRGEPIFLRENEFFRSDY